MLGISNSNLTMKFVQLHYFLSQSIGKDKIYCVSPLSKNWRDMSPLKLGPWVRIKTVELNTLNATTKRTVQKYKSIRRECLVE